MKAEFKKKYDLPEFVKIKEGLSPTKSSEKNQTDRYFQMDLIELELAKENYIKILYQLIETEEILDEKRQALMNFENFDCYRAFRLLTDETHGGITINELSNFLKKHDQSTLQQKWIKALIIRVD